MSLTTISEISRALNISTRTLRYYEQMGLIDSVKKDDYAYRTYDEATVKRLRRILVLRKLQMPLKQIAVILENENAADVIDAFRQKLEELDDEITTLSAIREIIDSFITRLNESVDADVRLLDDDTLLEAVDALTVRAKQPKYTMGFNLANPDGTNRSDESMREACELYQEAFGAVKSTEFTPYDMGSDFLHIIMEIHGVELLMTPYGNDGMTPLGGIWAYDNDDDLKKTIDVLSRDAQKVETHTSPHWPIHANITDKYGVFWCLHN